MPIKGIFKPYRSFWAIFGILFIVLFLPIVIVNVAPGSIVKEIPEALSLPTFLLLPALFLWWGIAGYVKGSLVVYFLSSVFPILLIALYSLAANKLLFDRKNKPAIKKLVSVIAVVWVVALAFIIYNMIAPPGRPSEYRKAISVADVACENQRIYVAIKNLNSKLGINTSSELRIRIDAKDIVSGIVWGNNTIPPNTHAYVGIECSANGIDCSSGKIHTAKVIGPVNAAEGSAVC